MAKEFFKDLPNTTTPLTADRLNGLLNGDEALGSIVVDDVSCKNMFDKGSFVAGDRKDAQPTIRISSRQVLYLEPGTYTFSTDLDTSVYRYEINTISSPAPVSSYDVLYGSGWKTTSTLTITIDNSTKGYFNLGVARINNSSLTISDISSANFQLEKGSTATEYIEYKQPVKQKSYGVKESCTFYANDFKCKNLLDEALLSTSAKSTGITYDGTKVYSTNPSTDTRGWNYASSNYYLTLEPGTYTISLKFQHKITNSSGGLFRFYKTDDTFFANFNANNVDYATKTFELSETTNLGLYFKLYDGQVNIQIEVGSEATPYTPYKNFNNTLIQHILYNNPVGNSGTINLKDNADDYEYLEIFGQELGGRDVYTKIWKNSSFVNQRFILGGQLVIVSNTDAFIRSAVYTISSNTTIEITGTSNMSAQFSFATTPSITYNAGPAIRIYRVVGHRNEQTSSSTSGTRMLSVVNEGDGEDR